MKRKRLSLLDEAEKIRRRRLNRDRQRAKKSSMSATERAELRVKRMQAKREYRRKAGARQRWEMRLSAVVNRAVDESWRNYAAALRQAKMLSDESRRAIQAGNYRRRYRTDPEFNIKERLRRQVAKATKRDGVAETMRAAIRRNGKSPTIERLFGYTIEDLKQHIERQFGNGMSWDAFMSGEIHIDHVRPQSSFDLTDEGQYQACWSLPNLRPVWAQENLTKSAKRVFLL